MKYLLILQLDYILKKNIARVVAVQITRTNKHHQSIQIKLFNYYMNILKKNIHLKSFMSHTFYPLSFYLPYLLLLSLIHKSTPTPHSTLKHYLFTTSSSQALNTHLIINSTILNFNDLQSLATYYFRLLSNAYPYFITLVIH